MLKRIGAISGGLMLALVVTFFLAGRPISDLFGYFRAGASTTVKSIENEIPDVVHDEKTEAELAAAREQLIDRQVQLNLSQNQLKNLEHEISTLKSAIADRGQVLASAYPVLQNAIDEKDTAVTFVSTNFSLGDFQHEIDDLLSMQERDENALRIKQAGFDRLKQSVDDGEEALASMKDEMLQVEQEFAILKTRREQARMESETLDLVAGASSTSKSATASIGQNIDRLKGQVEQLESHNAARRDIAPVRKRAASGKLTKSFNRLEALKKYASGRSTECTNADNSTSSAAYDDVTESKSNPLAKPLDAEEVVIHIKGNAQTRK